ncbi:response regulator transcription factor [Nitrogeniibacter aestuarii]|uniref:response regulator transcription factor n=1 Tax=Nitrogeniibacter aestuarii TaxID=2815343 RepID=UPI001D100E6F|nr:response regulator transcription factor [Nitrogeniibacter aestuarii]
MRVILIEDDVDLAQGVADFLRESGDTVDVEHDGRAALARLQAQRYDLALVDVGLPGVSGYELVRSIRAGREPMAIILITARDALSDRIYGLDLGADDYLPKPFELSELHARMRAVLRRSGHQSPRMISFGPLRLDLDDHTVTLQGEAMTLTGREWDLLEALMRAGGRSVPKDRLLSEGSSNAVEVYISRLRPRLEAAGVRIRSIRGFGYRLECPDATP